MYLCVEACITCRGSLGCGNNSEAHGPPQGSGWIDAYSVSILVPVRGYVCVCVCVCVCV